MIILNGKYTNAIIYTEELEESALAQVQNLINQEFTSGSTVRVMPDVHTGAGAPIGLTMTIQDKVVPNLVGVDIGCGMETIKLRNTHIELEALDKAIHQLIPSGFDIRKETHPFYDQIPMENLKCLKSINSHRAAHSLGTLGGGNHFIELAKDEAGAYYLIIHSGSRHFGLEVAKYYQKIAFETHPPGGISEKELIANLKAQGREKEILKTIGALKKTQPPIPKDLAWLEGENRKDYLNDMSIAQTYSVVNRKAMADLLIRKMKLKVDQSFTTIHNYIDLKTQILRKGSISAQKGEKVLIPMNMRDGSLLAIGKGNPEWNCSAPHGAGRLMSRTQAKNSLTLSDFKKAMDGIYSSTINQSTLDEAPSAYKPMESILSQIGDTVEIIAHLKPVYNFKATE